MYQFSLSLSCCFHNEMFKTYCLYVGTTSDFLQQIIHIRFVFCCTPSQNISVYVFIHRTNIAILQRNIQVFHIFYFPSWIFLKQWNRVLSNNLISKEVSIHIIHNYSWRMLIHSQFRITYSMISNSADSAVSSNNGLFGTTWLKSISYFCSSQHFIVALHSDLPLHINSALQK